VVLRGSHIYFGCNIFGIFIGWEDSTTLVIDQHDQNLFRNCPFSFDPNNCIKDKVEDSNHPNNSWEIDEPRGRMNPGDVDENNHFTFLGDVRGRT